MGSTARSLVVRGDDAARGLVVFDLDAVLLSGSGLSGLLAARLGRGHQLAQLERAQSWGELARARAVLARSLRTAPPASLRAAVSGARLAPGARRAVELLQQHAVVCAAVSLSWEFAVEAIAERLGIEHCLGTGLEPRGPVVHVWPEDKRDYCARLAQQLGVPAERGLLVTQLAEPPLTFARRLVARWQEGG